MKNKKLLLIVSLVLAMTMSLGGTLAYLTDTDADVNTMVLGNVKIEQHEYQRVEENGTYKTDTIDNVKSYVLEAFEQNKPLLPMVPVTAGDPNNGYDTIPVRLSQIGSAGGMDVLKGKNIQDKFVTVENKGNTNAYVRTYVALEAGSVTREDWNDLVNYSWHFTWNKTELSDLVNINGNNYFVLELVYNGYSSEKFSRHANGVLPAGETTYNSLAQVYLLSDCDNEDLEALDGNKNGTYDIIVLSQAVQADGFENAQTALEAGFPSTKTENGVTVKDTDKIAGWLAAVSSELPTVKMVADANALSAALNNVESGTKIVLTDDIKGNVTANQIPNKMVEIDGGNHAFEGSLTIDGKSAADPTTGLVIKNVNFTGGSDKDAYIRLGDGDSSSRYVNHVTISNCTFEGDGIVAVKSYTGGDKNVVIENCYVGEGMHSLCQLKNVAGLTITGCKVYSKNGVNLNQTPAMEMSGCTFDVQGYAVRIGVNGATVSGTYTIADSSLKSSLDDPTDAVIILRGNMAASTLTLTDTTVEGTTKIINASNATVTGLN